MKTQTMTQRIQYKTEHTLTQHILCYSVPYLMCNGFNVIISSQLLCHCTSLLTAMNEVLSLQI